MFSAAAIAATDVICSRYTSNTLRTSNEAMMTATQHRYFCWDFVLDFYFHVFSIKESAVFRTRSICF